MKTSHKTKMTPDLSRFVGLRPHQWTWILTVTVLFAFLIVGAEGDHDIGDIVKFDSNDSKEHAVKIIKKLSDEDTSDEHSFIHSLRKRKGNLGFIHGFVASLSVIILSELGDKTFFIAAIMAMRHSRVTVLAGAIGALGLMTVLSAMLGYATTVIPRTYTYYASSILFAVFGIKMIKEGWDMSEDEAKEEYEEVQADLNKKENEIRDKNAPVEDIETGIIRTPGRRFFQGILSTVFLQSFTLTFLAEWGDRSQITTIILGAREDVWGVILGGVLGHLLCTSIAVIGGRIVAQKISVRTVTLVGGVVFLMFAMSAFVIGPS